MNDYLNILLHTDEWQVPIEYGEVSMSSGDPHDNTADNAGVRVKSEPDSQVGSLCYLLCIVWMLGWVHVPVRD